MKLCVFKVGKSPKFFCDVDSNDHQSRMMGDWEMVQLIRVLSDLHPDDELIVIGRCRPRPGFKFETAFPAGNVRYVKFAPEKELTPYEKAQFYVEHPDFQDIDEFHYLMGPHARYNGHMDLFDNVKKEKVKGMMCFQNYVSPLFALMNHHPKARHFPYVSDRRYVFIARDFALTPKLMLAQNVKPFELTNIIFDNPVETSKQGPTHDHTYTLVPFRFESLVLYGRDPMEYHANIKGGDGFPSWSNRPYDISVVANQVTNNLDGSRYPEIKKNVLNVFPPERVGIIGEWKDEDMLKKQAAYFHKGVTTGWGENYYDEMRQFKRSIIFFNWRDCIGKASREKIKDNWITPKVYETMLLGCITYVHVENPKMREHFAKYISEDFLFSTPEELKRKIDEDDPMEMLKKQVAVLRTEYFDGSYFRRTLEKVRTVFYKA